MNKLRKLYSFHIGVKEIDAIKILRKNDINISRLLRESLRDMKNKLHLENERQQLNGSLCKICKEKELKGYTIILGGNNLW